MDNKFTQQLFDWLNTPKEKRNLADGALMVLQCDRNKIFYNNVMRMPEKYADVIEYHIKKWYNFRLQHTTHEQVEEMAREAAAIVQKHNLSTVTNEKEEAEGSKEPNQVGKRVDHDQLPLEIQALYAENLNHLHRMREVHLRLRQMSEKYKDGQMCPDSDRFPFLQELITLDKTYHSNWEKYDSYVLGQDVKKEPADKSVDKSVKAAPKKAAKTSAKTTVKKATKATAKKTTAAKAKK